jgi:hypothetical protein
MYLNILGLGGGGANQPFVGKKGLSIFYILPTSVADPGCFIPDPGSGSSIYSSRILDPGS